MTEADRTGGVGVMLPRDIAPADALPFARRADELGFDQLWVVEDLGFRGGVAQAAAALAVTERIVVGIGILPAGARNVAFAAMELATLGQLFPGRVIAGVGHGMPDWMRRVGAWPRSPLTLLDEYATALRELLRGEQIAGGGRYVTAAGLRLEEVAPEAPPVLLGVRGPKSLALAGRAADGVVLAEPATPEYIAAALREMGVAPADGATVVTYDVAAVADDPDEAVAHVRPALAVVGEPDWAPHIAPLSFADALWAHRREAADAEAFAATLPREWVQQLSIVGTPAQARSHIAARHGAGATTVVLTPVGKNPLAALESLARVLP